MRPDELERRLRDRLDALGPAPRAELLRVLTLPDFERADRIGEYWGNPKTRTFGELPIDCEEDQTLRAVLVGMLREPRSLNLTRWARPDRPVSCFMGHLREGAPGCSRPCWDMPQEPSS